MKLSFLVAGLCLLSSYSHVEAGLPGANEQCQLAWIVDSCAACEPFESERVECDPSTPIPSGKYCCNRPDLNSGGMGDMTECEKKALPLKASIITQCMSTPFHIMLLYAISDFADDTNPYQDYVCKSYEDAIDCVVGVYGQALSLGTNGECDVSDDLYGMFQEWLLEASGSMTDLIGVPDPNIFEPCKGYDGVAQCPDRENIKTAIVGHCVFRVLTMELSTDAKCINWVTCVSEIEQAFDSSTRAVCPNIEGYFQDITANDMGELSVLAQLNFDDCSDCAMKTAPLWEGIAECMQIPLALLSLPPNLLKDPDNADMLCDGYTMAVACIKYRYVELNALGLEGVTPTCSLQDDFHPLFMEYIGGSLAANTAGPSPELASLYLGCTAEFDSLSACPTQKGLRAALVASCSQGVRNLTAVNDDLKCQVAMSCFTDLKNAYATSYAVFCDTNSVFDSIIYNTAQMTMFTTFSSFNTSICHTCEGRLEFIKDSVMECLEVPINLVNLSKDLRNDAEAYNILKGLVCTAYTSAIDCIRDRHTIALGLENNDCSIANNFHAKFLEMIESKAKNLPSEIRDLILGCTGGFTIDLACPTKEKLKVAVVAHCATEVRKYIGQQDVQCVIFGDCYHRLVTAYVAAAFSECPNIESVFTSIATNVDDNNELKALSGLSPMECSACVSRLGPHAQGVEGCLQTAIAMLQLSQHFNLTSRSETSQFVCPAYYISLGCIKSFFSDVLGLNGGGCSLIGDFKSVMDSWIQLKASERTPAIKNTAEIFSPCTDASQIVDNVCPDIAHARTALVAHCASLIISFKNLIPPSQSCENLGTCVAALKLSYSITASTCPTDSIFDAVTSSPEDVALFSLITDFSVSQCSGGPDPELAICRDVPGLFAAITAGDASSCIALFTAITYTIEEAEYCEAFWDAMDCAAEKLVPNRKDECLETMRVIIEADPDVILSTMLGFPGISISDDVRENAPQTHECPRGNEMDLSVCSSTTGIMTEVLTGKAQGCLAQFLPILAVPDQAAFCTAFWDAFKCTAEAIAGEDNDNVEECLRRMKATVDNDPSGVVSLIEEQGLQVEERIKRFANTTDQCEVDIDDDDDDDDLGKERPVPAALKKCSKLSDLVMATQSCPLNLVNVNEACMSFQSFVHCIARNLTTSSTRTGDLYMHMLNQCVDLVIELVMRNNQRFRDRIGNLDIEMCREKEIACGEDRHFPLANIDCALTSCPTNYTCMMKSYCCPMKKPGMCPMMKETAPCVERLKTRCSMDTDCTGNQKCCDQGCGYMTCEMTEMKMKSMCEMSLDRVKERLYTQGACGDGTGIMEVPQCQNSKYGPVQGDMASGVFHCVDEDGRKIPGSEFRGNKDCTRTRPGRCPALVNACQNIDLMTVAGSCKSDDNCASGKKCCYNAPSGECVKTCVDPEDVTGANSVEVCPSGQERHCCPVNLVQGKVCNSDRTAIPRINPCGGCTVEFYDVNNTKVDCDQGVSMCLKKKAIARKRNQDMAKNYASRLKDFIDAHTENMDGDDDYDDDDMMSKRLDIYMDMKDEMKDDEMMDDMMSMVDEYGDMIRKIGQMPLDGRISEIGVAFLRSNAAYMELMAQMTCSFMNRNGLCFNGGSCIIGADDAVGYLQLCQCQPGYYGLLCEIPGQIQPNTRCMQYSAITNGVLDSLSSVGKISGLIHGLLNIFQLDYQIMPMTTCDSAGAFDEIQVGILLPMGDKINHIQYCVDTETGVRKPYTQIAMIDQALNCSKFYAPDVLTLPKRCRLKPEEPCNSDSEYCQYYFNPATEMCEKSSNVGYGFDDLTQCYQECGLQALTECPPINPDELSICPVCGNNGECPLGQACCPSNCGHTRCVDMYKLPKPCRDPMCNFETEFCHVEETDSGQVGTCKPFKPYCMLDMDAGYGDEEIGAYYFERSVRRCTTFTYNGQGGNANRFYELHQCKTECGIFADYKFDGPVCPIPRLVTPPNADRVLVDMCRSDGDCAGDLVCCSNGIASVCTSPVTVCGSHRCSPEAKCLNNQCVCPTCEDYTGTQVCGSNGMTYDNLCMLKKHACETMMNITVTSCTPSSPSGDAPCPIMVCTKEYMPICAYKEVNGRKELKTFGNPCMMSKAMICDGENYEILYHGECEQQQCASDTCELYETCMDDQCVCPSCGVKGAPICGHPEGLPSSRMTFSSMCAMRRYACLKKQLYVMYSMKPCSEPEREYECPATKGDIVHSAVRLCHPGTNMYCDEDAKCCPYGAGYRCIPMKYLKHKVMEKPGFCPHQSVVNFNIVNCYRKEYMCTDDSDVPENTKCCENLLCGHKTITVPLGLAVEKICGDNRVPIKGMTCDTSFDSTSTCPSGTFCMTQQSDRWNIGVCCQSSDADEPTDMAINGNRLCNVVSDLGLAPLCQNGGTCIGDLHMAHMCMCPPNFVGAFCEKEIVEYQDPCTEGVFNCLVDPCDNKMCHVEGATCIANYCGGCNRRWMVGNTDVTDQCESTKCTRLSSIMSAVFSLLPDDDDSMPTRKRRGAAVPTLINEELNDQDNIFDSYNLMQLVAVMKKVDMSYVPMKGIVHCEADGAFKTKQCFEHVEDEMDFCTCVDSMTGMMIKNAPKASKMEELDCTFVTAPDFPQGCLMVPSMAVCSETNQERFFFSSADRDCVSYMDKGCNAVMFMNSFTTYDDCMSQCSRKSVTPMECQTIRCGNGEVCAIVNGVVTCKDVTTIRPNHYYPEPSCEANGQYSPKQCHGNLCYCAQTGGTPVTDSMGDGHTLVCNRDMTTGLTTPETIQNVQRKRCANGQTVSICDGPGDPCDNCQMTANMNNNNNNNMADPNIDDNGACKNCQTCPSGQGKETCSDSCESMPACTKFPQAVCKVDRCTCTARYYKSNNQVVNCDAAQSQCEREKAALEKRLSTQAFQQRINANSNVETIAVMTCNEDGSYLARCMGNQCYCLNANNGQQHGEIQTGVTIDTIDCSESQKTTVPKQVRIATRVSELNLADIPQATRIKVLRAFKNKIEGRYRVAVIRAELKQGSVIYDADLENNQNSQVMSDTDDLASIANDLVEGGLDTIVEDGFIFEAVPASTTFEFFTEEEITPTTTAKPTSGDDTNTGLIIGVVIGGVALLLIIIVAIVCCNRSKKKKQNSMRFSDIKGKDNPNYYRP